MSMVKETHSPETTSEISDSLVDRIDGWISLVLKIMLIIGAVLEALQGNWLNTIITIGIVILAFTPLLMGYQFNVRIPSEFELLAVLFIYASLVLGDIYGFYTKYWWWDIFLHTLSGIILGIIGFIIVYIMNRESKVSVQMKSIYIAIFSFTFAVSIGAIWEIFEFSMDLFFGLQMQKSGLVDTMGDLIVDVLGALVVSFAGYFYVKKVKTPIFYNLFD